MSSMTLAQKISLRDAYLEAELAVLKMKTVKVNGVEYGRENLADIKAERKALDREIAALTSGSTTVFATFGRPE